MIRGYIRPKDLDKHDTKGFRMGTRTLVPGIEHRGLGFGKYWFEVTLDSLLDIGKSQLVVIHQNDTAYEKIYPLPGTSTASYREFNTSTVDWIASHPTYLLVVDNCHNYLSDMYTDFSGGYRVPTQLEDVMAGYDTSNGKSGYPRK